MGELGAIDFDALIGDGFGGDQYTRACVGVIRELAEDICDQLRDGEAAFLERAVREVVENRTLGCADDTRLWSIYERLIGWPEEQKSSPG